MAKTKNNKIYLDYAATAPIAPEVLKSMLPYLKQGFGNPSSIHEPGQKAREAIDEAREKIAGFLNCSAMEIVFTGSATEANNLAIFGVVRASQKQGVKNPHIITSQIEHPAVLEPCRKLEKQGIEVSYVRPDKQGIISPGEIKKLLKPNTILVSIMYANNEIGAVQPIAKISQLIKKVYSVRDTVNFDTVNFPIFHTDAVQAINYLDCDVQRLGVDLLTLSGHKIYGPKGVGGLYIKKGTPLEPLIFGGGQENGLRPGTENVAAIAGFAEAIKQIRGSRFAIKKLKNLKDELIDGILKTIPDSRLNGSKTLRLPNNVNVSIPGVEGEALVMALDLEGFAVSTGSACSSKKLEPSHVLLAMGLSEKQAHSSLRITLGRYTNEQEINKLLKVLPKIVANLRRISGYKT